MDPVRHSYTHGFGEVYGKSSMGTSNLECMGGKRREREIKYKRRGKLIDVMGNGDRYREKNEVEMSCKRS